MCFHSIFQKGNTLASESKLERDFQSDLIKDLRDLFHDCVILKNDANYLQGIPDLLILFGDRWAMLEVKASETSDHQPNQDYYVDKLDSMSYSAFIYPANKEEILHDLQRTFGA